MTEIAADAKPPGRVYVGTSGFAYAGWEPLFYPAGTPPSERLARYAERLRAVELNNTFYQQPRPDRVAAWLAATPASFRFAVKAQRGGSIRAFGESASAAVEWLTRPYRLFGERLGCVLFRFPESVKRHDARLATLLAAWPPDMPLAIEFQDRSWLDDDVHARLAAHRVALCATDLDSMPAPPDLRLTGPFLYVRLRRSAYSAAELDAWAARLAPFIDAGPDVFAFFRHDADGQSALHALALRERLLGSASVEHR